MAEEGQSILNKETEKEPTPLTLNIGLLSSVHPRTNFSHRIRIRNIHAICLGREEGCESGEEEEEEMGRGRHFEESEVVG